MRILREKEDSKFLERSIFHPSTGSACNAIARGPNGGVQLVRKTASSFPTREVNSPGAFGGKGNEARILHSTHPGSVFQSRKKLESPEDALPKMQIDFAKLRDGSLLEIIESPTDQNRTLFAVARRGRIRLAEEVEDCGRILVPIPRSTLGLSDVKLPRGVMPYKSVKQLMNLLKLFMRRVVDVPDEYAMLLSAFILYTWVADRLPTAVYLSVIGLPQSGKSTLLELLNLLCRQALLVSDITQAAAYQACSKYSPTLLIDEINWHSSGTMSNFRGQLRAGSGRSSRALRVLQSSTSFGPKVLCSLDASPDAALNSRCIQIVMAETDNGRLLKPSNPEVGKGADDLRQQLLRFRFNSYDAIRPALVRDAEQLRPRSRDLLCSLAAPLVKNRFYSRFLFEFMKTSHDPLTREPLDPRQEALMTVIWMVIHLKMPTREIRIGGDLGLAKLTNQFLLSGGEKTPLTDKAVGRMLASMGYRNTHRTNAGWVLRLDSGTMARCHYMNKTFDTW
jgi:hypothetical protein